MSFNQACPDWVVLHLEEILEEGNHPQAEGMTAPALIIQEGTSRLHPQ